jgi:predicted NUDIX family NTP pyrophosphohydrolase
MPKRSAGILLYRRPHEGGERLEVLLVHPGGPFWARRDEGAWSLPKGEHDDGEDAQACALRELAEETGSDLGLDPDRLVALGEVRLRSGKRVTAWAAEGDLDADAVVSNTFELEWPPRSGRRQTYPEVDRAGWFGLDDARRKLLPAQAPFLDRIVAALDG